MICQTHKLGIEQVCLHDGCNSQLLCSKCTLIHPLDHTQNLVEYSRVFNEEGKVILMTRTFENLKQRVSQSILNIKQQQLQLTDEIENMTFDYQKRLQTYLDDKLKTYKAEIRKFYHQLQNTLYTEQKKLQKVKLFPDDPYEMQINHFRDFKNEILRNVMDQVDSVEFKAGSKQTSFINQSNYENSYNRIIQTIDQNPFLMLKQMNDIPFEQQCIQALSIQNKFYDHTDWVNKLTFLESNQIFASCSSDSTIRVFDLNTDSEISKIEGHIAAVNTLIFWDDTKLISGSMDKTIRIWDWQSQTSDAVLYGHDKPVRALLKLDDDHFASAGGEKQIYIWQYSTKKLEKKLPECEDTILCLVKLHGDYIACGTAKGIVTIYDYQRLSGNQIRFLTIHNGAVKCLLYMKDEQRLITGGDDNLIYIIKYMQTEHPIRISGHKGSVSSLVHLNSPTFFGSASWDGQIILWDSEKREEILSIQENDNYIQSIIYMNDGKTIISGGSDHTIRVWTMKAQATLEELSMDLQSFNQENNYDKSANGANKADMALSTPRQNQCEVCNIF